ncbi:MAG: hypothetical protein CMI54_09000 [Parcubacteria group bacterium]|jgi:hypothetical protein|nr:hypothetical protein [Parcubacteria group bacterium]|tara:strand:- start:10309 stop:10947 length:639 start_codon:yes stop_codon:yes gene_type:complete
MLAEELHRKYRADLAEAKERDRREAALVFLDVTVEVGKFEVSSLTVRRYLLLEHLNSPFLGGIEKMPTKRDVVNFLWVMSPKYKPDFRSARRFYLLNWFRFLRWQSLAMKIAQLIIDSMANGTLPSGNKSNREPSPTWVAEMVDGAASQYSWTEQQIFDLPLARAAAYMKALTARLGGENTTTFAKHSDKVRHWYMAQIQKAADAEKKDKKT